MQSGQTLYYDLRLRTEDGRQHTFAKRIASQPAAESIADDVRQALGLEEPTLRSTDAVAAAPATGSISA